MADRDDPKLSVRPLSERKPAAVAASGADPLAEFVRMGSGRSIVEPAPVIRGKTLPVTGAVSSEVAVVKDLEAKLLADLEALSSAFYSNSAPTTSAPPEDPVTAARKPGTAASSAKPQPAEPPSPSPAATAPPPLAVLPPRDKPKAPAVSLTSRTPVVGPTGAAAEKP